MPTVLLRITTAKGVGGGFIAQLHRVPDESRLFPLAAGSTKTPLPAASRVAPIAGAKAAIPASLLPSTPELDPDLPGQALTVARVLDLVAARRHAPSVARFLRTLLSDGGLLPAWGKLRREGDLRTLLEIDTAAALADLRALPWERLCDEEGLFPALDRPASFARLASPRAVEHRRDDWPVRVLVAWCAEPEGPGAVAGIGAEAERRALERMFSQESMRYDVEYDVLEHPTVARIVDACERSRPHVLHFIGHGRGGAAPALSLWQPAGVGGAPAGYVDWPLANIAQQLQNRAPRLAFLNACRTGAGLAGAGQVPIAALDQAFVHAGSWATLAMQGDIPGDMATLFAETFYGELLKGQPVDRAVQAARQRLSQEGVGALEEQNDWSLPRLTLSVPPEAVIPRPAGPAKNGLAGRFVARLPERREAHAAIRCCAEPAAMLSQHLLVIFGPEGCGKSHLALWTAQACQRTGARVVPIVFDAQQKVDWLDALRWIRDGRRPERPAAPAGPDGVAAAAPAVFRDFDWRLNHRLAGVSAVPTTPAANVPVADRNDPFTSCPNPAEDFHELTFADFREALSASAAPGGQVLLLDRLAGVETQSLKKWLMEGLFQPVARGDVEGVRLVLVLDALAAADLRAAFEAFSPRPCQIDLPMFESADFRRVALQLCHQWSADLVKHPLVTAALDGMQKKTEATRTWGRSVFHDLDRLFELALTYP